MPYYCHSNRTFAFFKPPSSFDHIIPRIKKGLKISDNSETDCTTPPIFTSSIFCGIIQGYRKMPMRLQFLIGGFFAYCVSFFTLLCQRFKHQSTTEFEGIHEYCLFRKAHIFALAIVELFEYFFLFIREAFLQVLMLPCHVAEQLLHLRRVGSAVLLRYDVAVPPSSSIIFLIACLRNSKRRLITDLTRL